MNMSGLLTPSAGSVSRRRHLVVSGSVRVAAKLLMRLMGVCACREVLYENGHDGLPRVTGLRMSKASQEQVVEADAYVAALDVPGAKKLIPQVSHTHSSWAPLHAP